MISVYVESSLVSSFQWSLVVKNCFGEVFYVLVCQVEFETIEAVVLSFIYVGVEQDKKVCELLLPIFH